MSEADLHAVQRRREPPTIRTQRLQVFAQNRIISPALAGSGPVSPPFAFRLTDWFPDAAPHPGARDRDGVPAGAHRH